jgi:hypothetical protein
MLPDRSLDESALIKAITKIAIDLARVRDQDELTRVPVLDIVFLLPSQQEKAHFEGLRLHSFDSFAQILRIESSVPEKMVNSIHAERFVTAIMLDAIDAAAEFFAEQAIVFDAPKHLALVDLITTNEQRTLH